MSEFVPRDMLPELWNEILQTHWKYLEIDENLDKIEERKHLELQFREYLRIVTHDRKFFLPETNHVLKKSILKMDEFSANKAAFAFESISNYANNLFIKPWRREYRVIKMYSGFYEHEIRSSLIDAEKLFEAMGYKVENDTLVLEGAICPDQVRNVSRDALIAYVECQIMKQIYSGLLSIQLSCSWVDIYNFREMYIGGPSQAIKAIAFNIQEKHYHKEQNKLENCHTAISPVSCNSCNLHQCSQLQQQLLPYNNVQIPYSSCSIHSHPQQNIYTNPAVFQNLQNHNNKPIEHFDPLYDCDRQHRQLNHFEHQQIPTSVPQSYDCIDGQPKCNFNAFNHPYNVSGNRYPIPYNISNHFNHAGGNFSKNPPQNNCNGHYSGIIPPVQNCYAPQHIAPSYNGPAGYNNGLRRDDNGANGCDHHRSDHLIDLNDTNVPYNLVERTRNNTVYNGGVTSTQQQQQQQQQVLQQPPQPIKPGRSKDTFYDVPKVHRTSQVDAEQNYDYENKKFNKKHLRNSEILEQYGNERSITSKQSRISDFDSYEDDSDVKSKLASNKNQDGVGSFESWDFVYQKLENQGYNKDVGDRGDLLVQGLDLDSLNVGGNDNLTLTKKHKNIKPAAGIDNTPIIKSKNLEKPENSSKDLVKIVRNNGRVKNVQNYENATVQKNINNLSRVQKQPVIINNHTNNNNNGENYNKNKTLSRPDKKIVEKEVKTNKRLVNENLENISNEWSCKHCTYLNSNSRRICEICCKSKDFSVEARSTQACV